MTGSVNSIQLRPATAADEAFLLRVYKTSRGQDLRALGWDENRIDEFLELQYEAQQRFFSSEYARALDQIIVREDKALGRLFVDRREHEIRCIDLALLPEYRDAGIGTHLLKQLQEEAGRAKKPLRLQIIRFSPALSLLERLGFVRSSETGTHFQMEWRG